MPKLTEPEKKLLTACKKTIDALIHKWTDDVEADSEVVIDENTRYRSKDRVMVDAAANKMWAPLFNKHGDLLDEVDDLTPVWREAYHYAVDAYFRIYHGRNRGRPSLDKERLRQILEMSERGMSLRQMAPKLGLNPDNVTEVEKMRGQLRTARKRLGTGKKPPE